jgi:hypothetical protein
MAGNDTTVNTVIYFTTQSATAPDITSLNISDLSSTSMKINYTTDIVPDTKFYRINTTAYSGSWVALTASPMTIGSLTANISYYYQVKFVKNGQTSYSVPMSFKTAPANTGIVVNKIERILHGDVSV